MRCVFVCMAALLAVTACRPQDKVAQTWIGAPETKLLSIWGAPSQSFVTEDGTRVLVYRREGTEDVIIPSAGQSSGNPSREIRCETAFTVQNGSIVSFSHSGSEC